MGVGNICGNKQKKGHLAPFLLDNMAEKAGDNDSSAIEIERNFATGAKPQGLANRLGQGDLTLGGDGGYFMNLRHVELPAANYLYCKEISLQRQVTLQYSISASASSDAAATTENHSTRRTP